jgi:hypothetical protein
VGIFAWSVGINALDQADQQRNGVAQDCLSGFDLGLSTVAWAWQKDIDLRHGDQAVLPAVRAGAG